jgi:hypothetical protein
VLANVDAQGNVDTQSTMPHATFVQQHVRGAPSDSRAKLLPCTPPTPCAPAKLQ